MLDNLVDAYQFGTDDSTLRFIANNLVVIIMYILVPYLTTYFIGGSAAGAFISKVVGSSALVLAASKTLATQRTSRSTAGSNGRTAGSNHGTRSSQPDQNTQQPSHLQHRNNTIQVQTTDQ
jgi:hypothetical protein